MKMKGYTLLGWLTWQGVKTVTKRKADQRKAKVGALAFLLLVVVGGLVAARQTVTDD